MELYRYAIDRAVSAAQIKDYAGSAAWLAIAQELRLSHPPPKPAPAGRGTKRKELNT